MIINLKENWLQDAVIWYKNLLLRSGQSGTDRTSSRSKTLH